MNPFNLFTNNTFVKSTAVEIICPSCSQKCADSEELCPTCSYDLKEYKANVLLPYSFFNEALKNIDDEKYFDALIAASKFLAFYPNDEDGNKLYIYLLHKNNKEAEYHKALEKFEKDFVRNPWIMEIETKGIDSYILPSKKCEKNSFNKNAFDDFTYDYVTYRTHTVADIIKLTNDFYDVVRIYRGRRAGTELVKFYETNFLQFISKKEIKVDNHDGLMADELTNDELQTIDILTKITDKKKKQGSLVTIHPAIYLRHALVAKEKCAYVDNSKPEKSKSEKREPQLNKISKHKNNKNRR